MIPNLLPALVAFGLWGIIVGKVGLVVSVVGAISLGIIVDDTIHFISKYLRARREHGMTPPNAVRYSFKIVGAPMISTTIILASGFMILTFSGFHMNSELGLMTVITLLIALILDLYLLPVILIKGEI
jgi:predicted RND superfamily exporter protein